MILVTGASGLLGASTAAAAGHRYGRAVGVSNRHPITIPNVTDVHVDLRQRGAGADVVCRHRPAWVIHCAAATNVDWCEAHAEESHRLNVEASRELAAAARGVGARFLYVSTDSVFDGKQGEYAEEDAPRPLNVYAATKLGGEVAVSEEAPNSLIVRTSIYGWNAQAKLSLAEWVLDRLKAGKEVPGFTDVVFSPLLAHDLATILLDMIERDLQGVFHVGARDACSKYEFAVRIAECFWLDAGLVRPSSIDVARLVANRPKNTSLNVARITRVLQRPMPSVREGLQRFRSLAENGCAASIKLFCRE